MKVKRNKRRSRRQSKSLDQSPSKNKSKKSENEPPNDIEFLPGPKPNDDSSSVDTAVKTKWWSNFFTKFKPPSNHDDSDEDSRNGGDLDFLPDRNSKGLFTSVKIKCSEFINSFIPSKHQLNDRKLQNRIKMCILAVCLMWATSLRVAVYIASHAVKVPQMQMLFQSCKNTFQIANEEKGRYAKCVDVQLEQCKSGLHRSIVTEVMRVNQSSTLNSDKVNYAKDKFERCTSNYNDLRFALERWVDSGQPLPFEDSDCSNSEKEKIMSDVGDINLVRAKAVDITEEYSQQSQNTVNRMATYAKLRSNYDAQYLANHTKDMQDVVKNFVLGLRDTVPEVDLKYLSDTLYESIDEAMSCVSPRSAVKGICKTGKGVRELIAEAYVAWNELEKAYVDRVTKLHERYQKYRTNVRTAYESTHEFYNSKSQSFTL